jgi:hypothetical protein
MEIKLTPEEMFIARCDWEKQSSTGTKVFSEFIAQAQLRKVVKYIEENREMEYDRDEYNAVFTGRIILSAECWAALREAVGLTMTENPVDK